VRHDVLEALRALNPAVELGIAETAHLLRDEGAVLDHAAGDVLERMGGGPAVQLEELRGSPPALVRLVLRGLAERAAGEPRSLSRSEVEAILALGRAGGTQSLDLGGELQALVEYGTLRFTRESEAEPPEPVELSVPGRARFGGWEVEARMGAPGDVAVSAEALGQRATVRCWREGDRIRPVGLGGTKTLQDLFTDRKVPRALRRTLPVVEAGGVIAWVAGVALDERFAAGEAGTHAVWLSARQR
jgi:tRNA(Ile)-lysidine synthase